ncbi:T9SS type A sorting domain-containing protein [Altibacter sp.]|uniref:type IX secretion system anionic LPS delivery protein PorZ n=1 Tax=Altibacter sp. TaxID=2024823 RepID=UPI00258F8BDB|nr:T9SS type A sorting domain-containing protein [Altibacter sp.]MCW9038395.1 T9SS type A sorting domain-containing protein [Altibacter sp.]
MKYFAFLFLTLFSAVSTAQNFEDQWEGYFSYASVIGISQGNGKIYAAAENSVFHYDLGSQELQTISSVNGLSAEAISTIYYSENFGVLVVGYETGLIEIVIDGEDNVLSVVDILDKQTIPPNKKRINHFNEYEGNLYIAADFGISVFDLSALEFGDSYFIGPLGTQIDINQTTVVGDFIYASSSQGGVLRALVDNPDLIDFEEWSTAISGFHRGVQGLGDKVYTLRNDNAVLELFPGGGFVNVGNFSEVVVGFTTVNDLLTITTTNTIQAYANGFVQEAAVNSVPGFEYELQAGIAVDNNFYLGTTQIGMLQVPFGTNTGEQILPGGPLLNRPFALDVTPGQVWVVYGDIDVSYNPFPRTREGISNLREETWTNITYDDLSAAVGGEINDLVEVTINPSNTDEAWISSFERGLLKVTGLEDFLLYNQNNSPLEEVFVPPNNDNAGIRIYGSDFDRSGNLWALQSFTDDALIKVSPGGQFQIINVSTIVDGDNEVGFSDLKISREGYVFFGASKTGLIGYNPANGQFNSISDDVGNGNLVSTDIRSLAFDNQNRLWIGSTRGLRVLFSVGNFFNDEANNDAQPIIFLEDGVPQELLFQQSITDIEVDGSNNKWIATSTTGVFYLSANGQETLLRFTKDNSPLPSNGVQDIAIDPLDGTVYFATTNGLVAYKGTSTAPRDNLEEVYVFPNPVRPGFSGNVTIDGLTARANVKITDIEGNLVHEDTSEGGSIQWDTTAFGRYKVASGVYLVLITTDDALETKVSKIMIIR